MTRYKNIFFILLLFVTPLLGEQYRLKTHSGHHTPFSKASGKKSQDASSQNVYYQYGLEENAYRFVTTGFIRVELRPGIDPQQFADAYGLQLIRQNTKSHYLFKNISGKNDMQLCGELGALDTVETALPRFQGKKRLQ